MRGLTLKELAGIVGGKLSSPHLESNIFTDISTDSRKVQKEFVFFPLVGNRDGHNYIPDAVKNGAAAVVVEKDWLNRSSDSSGLPLLLVDSPLKAMHRLAKWWRNQITGKVIAVTGSNGKTIMKDALVRLLSENYICAGSPGSFNNQIGVPLSMLRIPLGVDFAVLEAGISGKGEMARLESIIKPHYGVLTNIGLAHIAAMGSREVTAVEKIKLFRNLPPSGWLLVPAADPVLDKALEVLDLNCPIYRFGSGSSENLPGVVKQEITKRGTSLTIRFPTGDSIRTEIATPSAEVIANIEGAIVAAYLLGMDINSIERSLSGYTPSPMRMEIWRSPTGITLINDAYSADPTSVISALKTLNSMNTEGTKTFVFGGMRGLGKFEREEHLRVGIAAAECGVDTLVLVGGQEVGITQEAFQQRAGEKRVIRCSSSAEVKKHLLNLKWGDSVLVKGPRNTGIDQVAHDLMDAMAPNRFYINLQAVNENISRYRNSVGPQTRIMAMVKALAYGSDAIRLVIELQRTGVEHFGVASTDEGVALRHAGVYQNILVMICSPDESEKLIYHNLTPVIYSGELIKPLSIAARGQRKHEVKVHLELDSGMGRLGVKPEQVIEVANQISATGNLRLVGLMTHFACAEDPSQDDFTNRQIECFIKAREALREIGFTDLICHAGATAGSVRFPHAAFDMVRIGLGLYGIYPSPAVAEAINLDLAISLVSRVIEIKKHKKGERIGYGGTFEIPRDDYRVGVVPIGYHDGIPLNFSNKGRVIINGKESGIIGRVSMDSMTVDLSEHPDVKTGANVLIYGKYDGYELLPETVAADTGTIPYELLARLGPRVQRIFIEPRY